MRNKSAIYTLLFNPFHKIAGWKALIIGLIFFAASTFIAQLGGVVFNGTLSVQVIPMSMQQAFIVHAISLFILILTMYIAGRIFSASAIRFIDVAGTIAFSRAPFVVIALIVCIPMVNQSWQGLRSLVFLPGSSLQPGIITILVLSLILVIICIVWFVVLAYNAFSVSCNIKGYKGGIVFTGAILISFILSTLAVFAVYPSSIFPVSSQQIQNTENAEIYHQSDTISKIAIESSVNIKEGNYENIIAYFDDRMKNELPAERLSEIMADIKSRFGEITEVNENVQHLKVKEDKVILVPVQFEKTSLYFRFAFNKNNQIIGFYM